MLALHKFYSNQIKPTNLSLDSYDVQQRAELYCKLFNVNLDSLNEFDDVFIIYNLYIKFDDLSKKYPELANFYLSKVRKSCPVNYAIA